jgi:hypothetical protein
MGDRCTTPETTDPDLCAIRAFIDGDDVLDTVEQTGSFDAHPVPSNRDRSMRPSEKSPAKTSHSRGFFEHSTSLIKRPDAPRILAFVVLVAFILLKPGLVFFLFGMSLLTVLVLFFSLGPDPFQSWAINRYKKLRGRDPDAAERLRQCAARTSKTLSALIDKLPEKWTTGLYLPDFEEPQDLPEIWATDPFERLAQHRDADVTRSNQVTADSTTICSDGR